MTKKRDPEQVVREIKVLPEESGDGGDPGDGPVTEPAS